jgi:hypothetical protein
VARLQCLRFDQAGWAELGLETPSASHFVGVRDGALTHYYRPSQSAFFEDLAESTPEQDAETLRRLAKMIDTLPHSLRECFDRRFASSNDVDERADERVLAKSRLECEVKQEVRGKLVNDKYRTTFVWYDESEVQALLKVLSDPESGWALFAVDSNTSRKTCLQYASISPHRAARQPAHPARDLSTFATEDRTDVKPPRDLITLANCARRGRWVAGAGEGSGSNLHQN